MPKVALADTGHDWKGLLRAAAPYADAMDLKEEIAALQAALDRFEELEGLRAELAARRLEATQELHAVRESGKLAAIQIRSILRGRFGHDSERLTEFKMRPRRSRRKESAPQPPALPE